MNLRATMAAFVTMGALAAAQETVPAIPAGAPIDPAAFDYERPITAGPAALVTLPLDAAALAHSRGPHSRFADVRIVDASNRQIPYLLEPRDTPLDVSVPFGRVEPGAPELQSAPGHQRSTYRALLPFPRLPGATLVLSTSARTFRRDVTISVERAPDRRRRHRWAEVVAVRGWVHADPGTDAPRLVMPVASADATDLLVTIDEGDNAPLPLTGMRLELPSYRLRFHRPGGEPLRLLYGSATAAAPEYDLALLPRSVLGSPVEEISAAPEPAPPMRNTTIVSRKVFWGFLIVAVIALVALVARLATSPPSGGPSPSAGPRPSP
jgi:hypothetical protein